MKRNLLVDFLSLMLASFLIKFMLFLSVNVLMYRYLKIGTGFTIAHFLI